MKPITRRRLVDTSRWDLTGEVLPAQSGRELVPWEEAEVQASRNPPPLLSIHLPALRGEPDAPSMTYERRSLQREPSIESDFLLPVLQATAISASAMIVTAVLAWVFHWHWKYVLLAFGLALAYALLQRIRHMDSLLWSVETLTGHDVNGDGKVGQPGHVALVNPAQSRADVRKDVDATEQAAARAELVAFLHRCYVTGTAETAHGVKAGGPDRDAYLRQRDALMALGVAAWKNPTRPKAGWKMAVSYQKAQELIARHVL